jgi:tetratricopeptide (TPR) repeat protein
MGLLGRRAHVAGLAVAAALLASPAVAQPPKGGPALTEAQEKAREHFQHARELYQAGSYHEAIAELEAARELDPKAKDLVFNLGVVNEKLGNIDDALTHFRHYLEMDLDAQERARAESLIKRLEGAKREVKPEVQPAVPAAARPASPPPPPPEPPRGRVDGLTITFASIAGVTLIGGAALGIKALADKPSISGTYPSYTAYLELHKKAEDAHTLAVYADGLLAVGAVATVTTAVLYFARRKNPRAASVEVSASPLIGGGAVGLVEGRF